MSSTPLISAWTLVKIRENVSRHEETLQQLHQEAEQNSHLHLGGRQVARETGEDSNSGEEVDQENRLEVGNTHDFFEEGSCY